MQQRAAYSGHRRRRDIEEAKASSLHEDARRAHPAALIGLARACELRDQAIRRDVRSPLEPFEVSVRRADRVGRAPPGSTEQQAGAGATVYRAAPPKAAAREVGSD